MKKFKNYISFLNNANSRDTWVIKHLKGLNKDSTLLDAGAGEGRYRPFCDHLKYTSQDFAQYDGKGDGEGFHTGTWMSESVDIVSDITSIPVKASSFDAVLCTEVIEHVPSPNDAIAELARILRPGGQLILTSPFNSLTHMAPYHFCTGFSRYWYENILAENDMEIMEIKANGNYFDTVLQEMVRFPLELAKYSGIRLISYLLYVFILIPLVPMYFLSKLTRGSESLSTFGYMVLAVKKSHAKL